MIEFQNSIKSMIMKPGYEINNLEDYVIYDFIYVGNRSRGSSHYFENVDILF